MTASRVLGPVAWLTVLLVLAVSGLTKLLAPDGATPHVLRHLADLAPYPWWQRALGLAELTLAACVALPRSRRGALQVAAGLFGAFSLLLGASATDRAFVADCGCFAGLADGARYYGWLVLRNAALVFVALLGAGLGRPRAWTSAGLGLVLAASVPGVVGELQLRQAAYRQLAAAATGSRHQGFQGLPLPSMTLIDQDGRVLTTDQALRPGDVIAFMSRACPHCLTLAPSLAALDDSLRADGRRAVLVLVDSGRVPTDWLARLHWDDRAALATLDREALLRLGVDAVPRLLQLGPEREVQFNEAYPLATSLWKSLDLVARRVPDAATEAWRAIAAAVFGTGARLDGRLELVGGMVSAPVMASDGTALGRLCIVQDGWRPADVLELAVGLDPDDRVRGVVPLSAGAYARVFTPAVGLADSLVGLTLAEADTLLARHGHRSDLAAPAWRSLRKALSRIEPITR